jgi:hypothetical protein
MPLQQLSSPGQTLPQAPQWFRLPLTPTHSPLQQRVPRGQLWPHAPQ